MASNEHGYAALAYCCGQAIQRHALYGELVRCPRCHEVVASMNLSVQAGDASTPPVMFGIPVADREWTHASVRLQPGDWSRLKDRAVQAGMSISALVEQHMRLLLDGQPQ